MSQQTSTHYRQIEQRIGKATSNQVGNIVYKSFTLAIARYYGIGEYLPFKFTDVNQEITEDSFIFWYQALVTYQRSDVNSVVERLQGEQAITDQLAGKTLASAIYRQLK